MKNLIKSKLFLQVIVATMVATLATVGIVAATTTIGTNISTEGTFTASATSTLNGIVIDISKFTVEDTSGNTAIGGTLAVTGATTLSSTLAVTGAAVLSTASSTGAVKFKSLGIATSSPMTADIAIGSSVTATSTIAATKFCVYATDPAGRAMWITLAITGNSVFASSTTPCNQ